MNEILDKIPTMTDEALMRDIKEAIDEVPQAERSETLEDVLKHLEGERIAMVQRTATIDRLLALVHRYRREVTKV